jgi:hypothetical protein
LCKAGDTKIKSIITYISFNIRRMKGFEKEVIIIKKSILCAVDTFYTVSHIFRMCAK